MADDLRAEVAEIVFRYLFLLAGEDHEEDYLSERSAAAAEQIHDLLDSKRLVCPFCGENDFDHVGLKIHFERRFCPSYGANEEVV